MALKWDIVLKKYCIFLGLTVILLFAVFFNSSEKVIAEGDLLGPTITELSPQPEGTITTSSPQTVSFRVYDPNTIDVDIMLKVDEQNIDPTVVWGDPETGPDTVSESTYSFANDHTEGAITAQLPKLSSGQHTIYYKLKDGLGNVTENSYIFTIVDNEAPDITNYYPPEGSVIRFATPLIAIKLTDDSKIAADSLYLYIDGTRVQPNFNQVLSTIRFTPTEAFTDGIHSIQLSALDEAGNNLVSEWNFIINTQNETNVIAQAKDSVITSLGFFGDTDVSLSGLKTEAAALTAATAGVSSPVVSDLFPAPAGETDQTAPLFSLRFSDPDKLSTTVIIKIDNQAVTPKIVWDGIYETRYDSCTGQPYDVRIGNDYTKGTITAQSPLLTSGQHTIYYNLKDLLGNTIEEGYSFTILADTGNPQVTEKSPADGIVIATPKPVIKARIVDSSPINSATVKMKLNGNLVLATFNPITSYISYTVPEPLKNGTYFVEVSAADIFGNTASSVWNFTISDTTPATIDQLSPARNKTVTSTSPTIGAVITDLSGIQNPVYLNLDGDIYEVEHNPITRNVSYIPATPLEQGMHNVNMTVYDFQGNKSTMSWPFTVDTLSPVITDLYPSVGMAVVSARPIFSLKVSDPSQLNSEVTFKIDNQSIFEIVRVNWDGIYETQEEDGETYLVRIGTDYTKGTVNLQLPQLSKGEHTIYYCIKDKLGHASEKTYSFTVSDAEGPTLSESSPSDGTIVADPKPVIKAKLSDANYIVADSIIFTLNDKPVNFTYNQNTGIVSYQPIEPLSPGQKTVQITATDELGNVSISSWSFTISDTFPPEISDLLPPPMMGIRTPRPEISAKVVDEEGIDTSKISLTVDGVQLSANFAPETPGSVVAGTVYSTPVADLSNSSHTVLLTLFDLAGNQQQKSWQFGVNVFEGMIENLGDCTTCHNEGLAALELRHVAGSKDCTLCHGIIKDNQTLVPGDHGDGTDCASCHYEHTTADPVPLGQISCTTCHQLYFQDTIPVHGTSSEINLHNYAALNQDCLNCHLSNLTEEHNIFRDNGVNYNCKTCHLSTDTNVKKAIAENDTACSACHAVDTSHEAQHISGIDTSCADCHSENLVSDHMTNRPELGLSCKDCHTESLPTVASSVYDQNRMLCSRCHSDGHGLKLTPQVPSDIPLYEEIEWSSPIDSMIFNDPWMPVEFSTGSKLLISRRDTAMSGGEVWNFYHNNLISGGWNLDTSAPADPNFFNVTFSKDSRKVRISFYGGENHNASPLVGYRIEILYK